MPRPLPARKLSGVGDCRFRNAAEVRVALASPADERSARRECCGGPLVRRSPGLEECGGAGNEAHNRKQDQDLLHVRLLPPGSTSRCCHPTPFERQTLRPTGEESMQPPRPSDSPGPPSQPRPAHPLVSSDLRGVRNLARIRNGAVTSRSRERNASAIHSQRVGRGPPPSVGCSVRSGGTRPHHEEKGSSGWPRSKKRR